MKCERGDNCTKRESQQTKFDMTEPHCWDDSPKLALKIKREKQSNNPTYCTRKISNLF